MSGEPSRDRAADPVAVVRLRVDPVACEGVGICAHLAPELVRVDSWGYPLLPRRPLSAEEQRWAARAVAGCPRRALFLDAEA